LNGIVDRGFQLRAGLDLFTSEADGGNQASSDEQGTTLFLVVGHVNIIGEQKANIKATARTPMRMRKRTAGILRAHLYLIGCLQTLHHIVTDAGGLTLPHPTAKSDEGSLELTEEIMRLRAYRFFEKRGYEHGHDLEDWLQAKAEVFGKGLAQAA
jgi:hypothetical protein